MKNNNRFIPIEKDKKGFFFFFDYLTNVGWMIKPTNVSIATQTGS